MEDELLKVLKKNHLIHSGAENRKVIIESFSADSLKRLNDRYPQLFLVQLGYPEKMDLPAISRYADAVGPDYQGVTESFVRKAHEEQLQVHPWTVNSVSDMKRLTGFGVDGMFTNYPDKADDITQSP
jgi:glycerophosphoryl diester phosphodiesterase